MNPAIETIIHHLHCPTDPPVRGCGGKVGKHFSTWHSMVVKNGKGKSLNHLKWIKMVNIHLQAVNCCDFPKAFKFRRLMAIWWLGTSWGEADLETEPLTVRLPGITRAAFTLLDENQVFFTQGGHLCLGSCMTPFPSMKGNNHLSKIVKKGPTSRYF